MRTKFLPALAGILAVPAAVLAFNGTAAAAPAQTGNSLAQASSKVTPLAPAPNCVSFSQYKHGNAATGYYTNVYLDNGCSTGVRVKVIMVYGYDSGCIQLTRGQQDYKFRSNSITGPLQPYVDRIDAC
ncbi:hypothetical protein ABZ490_50995 [Streptomyces sp. NPDC005811]|uniref:hypothetical protein n=1 Tax=Streptomyces sp. NPDC005811 TaxID=3154565 RepID=UPI0033C8B868